MESLNHPQTPKTSVWLLGATMMSLELCLRGEPTQWFIFQIFWPVQLTTLRPWPSSSALCCAFLSYKYASGLGIFAIRHVSNMARLLTAVKQG